MKRPHNLGIIRNHPRQSRWYRKNICYKLSTMTTRQDFEFSKKFHSDMYHRHRIMTQINFVQPQTFVKIWWHIGGMLVTSLRLSPYHKFKSVLLYNQSVGNFKSRQISTPSLGISNCNNGWMADSYSRIFFSVPSCWSVQSISINIGKE